LFQEVSRFQDLLYYITQAHMCNISKHNNIIQYVNIENMVDREGIYFREDRICQKCSLSLIGDEFHYLFVCNCHDILELRNKYIPNYFTTNASLEKMSRMLSLCNVELRFVINFLWTSVSHKNS
jgi:hypothetical protein